LISTRATDYVFENFDTTLFKSGGQPWAGGVVNVEVGTFINGFTPTAGNLSSWLANWKADTCGFYDPSGPEWSAALVLADNSVFKQNAQLYLWAFDSHTGHVSGERIVQGRGLDGRRELAPGPKYEFSVVRRGDERGPWLLRRGASHRENRGCRRFG